MELMGEKNLIFLVEKKGDNGNGDFVLISFLFFHMLKYVSQQLRERERFCFVCVGELQRGVIFELFQGVLFLLLFLANFATLFVVVGFVTTCGFRQFYGGCGGYVVLFLFASFFVLGCLNQADALEYPFETGSTKHRETETTKQRNNETTSFI
jgi:hypothetical protein